MIATVLLSLAFGTTPTSRPAIVAVAVSRAGVVVLGPASSPKSAAMIPRRAPAEILRHIGHRPTLAAGLEAAPGGGPNLGGSPASSLAEPAPRRTHSPRLVLRC